MARVQYFSSAISVGYSEVNNNGAKRVHVTEEGTLDVLKHIKIDKSDQVYPWTLWEAREEITGALARIFV